MEKEIRKSRERDTKEKNLKKKRRNPRELMGKAFSPATFYQGGKEEKGNGEGNGEKQGKGYQREESERKKKKKFSGIDGESFLSYTILPGGKGRERKWRRK